MDMSTKRMRGPVGCIGARDFDGHAVQLLPNAYGKIRSWLGEHECWRLTIRIGWRGVIVPTHGTTIQCKAIVQSLLYSLRELRKWIVARLSI
jgi:hypothetical protein